MQGCSPSTWGLGSGSPQDCPRFSSDPVSDRGHLLQVKTEGRLVGRAERGGRGGDHRERAAQKPHQPGILVVASDSRAVTWGYLDVLALPVHGVRSTAELREELDRRRRESRAAVTKQIAEEEARRMFLRTWSAEQARVPHELAIIPVAGLHYTGFGYATLFDMQWFRMLPPLEELVKHAMAQIDSTLIKKMRSA
jgi:hypothetical protein